MLQLREAPWASMEMGTAFEVAGKASKAVRQAFEADGGASEAAGGCSA